MTHVFISYAREDGEDLARQIRTKLSENAPKVTIWRDREYMEGGKGWWRQITEAIDTVDVLVLVMTPCSMRSDTVRREWRYARKQGVTIYPVGEGIWESDEFATLPNWIRKAHTFDFEKEWSTFVNYINSPIKTPKVPFMVPDLPSSYVPRPELTDPLVQALTKENGNTLAIRSKLLGAGGLGKTVLAQAVASHDDVVEVFEDGILWVTLGNDAKLLNECARLYVALTGERPNFIDVEDAAFHLGELLEQRNCLLVIDDVWHRSDLAPFLQSLRGGAALITTRLPDLGEEFDTVPIGTMSAENGLSLLCRGIDSDPDMAPALADLRDLLSSWPLLLELANAQLLRRIRLGHDLRGAVGYINDRFRSKGVVAFDMRDARHRNDALALSVNISLDMAGSAAAEALIKLGLCPEDTDVPLDIAATLWGTDPYEAEDISITLNDFSLITFDLRTEMIRVHDVIRSYAVSQIEGRAGRQLAFAEELSNKGLARAPYGLRWLPYHLAEAGAFEQLRALFSDLGWLTTCIAQTNLETVLDLLGLMPEDARVSRLEEALALSGALVGNDAAQIAGQMVGRLGGDALSATPFGAAWIEPLDPILIQAGGPLVGRMNASTAAGIWDFAWDPAGHLLVLEQSGKVSRWHVERARLVATCEEALPFPKRFLQIDGHFAQVQTVTGQVAVYDSAANAWAREESSPTLGVPAQVVPTSAKGGLALLHDGTLADWPPSMPTRTRFHKAPLVTELVFAAPLLLAGTIDGEILVLDPQTNDVQATHAMHAAPITQIVPTQGQTGVSRAQDGTIASWDLTQTAVRLPIRCTVEGAACLSVTQHVIAVGTSVGTIELIDRVNGDRLRVLAAHRGPVTALSFSPDGAFLVSGGADGAICRWNLERPEKTGHPTTHNGPVSAVAIAPDGQVVSASGAERLAVGAQDIRLGNCIWSDPQEADDQTAVLLLPGRHLAFVPGRSRLDMQGPRPHALHLRQASGHVLTVDATRELALWDVHNRRCIASHSLVPDSAQAAAITPSFSTLILARRDGTCHKIALDTGAATELPVKEAQLITISADGCTIVTVTNQNQVHVSTPVSECTFDPAGPRATALALSPETRYLALAQGRMLTVWGLDGVLVAGFTAEEEIISCAFGQDPTALVIGTQIGRVARLTLHLDPEVQHARRRA